jgi:hypothetical protein
MSGIRGSSAGYNQEYSTSTAAHGSFLSRASVALALSIRDILGSLHFVSVMLFFDCAECGAVCGVPRQRPGFCATRTWVCGSNG